MSVTRTAAAGCFSDGKCIIGGVGKEMDEVVEEKKACDES